MKIQLMMFISVENEPLPKLTNKEQDLKAYLVKKVRKVL